MGVDSRLGIDPATGVNYIDPETGSFWVHPEPVVELLKNTPSGAPRNLCGNFATPVRRETEEMGFEPLTLPARRLRGYQLDHRGDRLV